MSHITTVKNDIEVNSSKHLLAALNAMSNGLTTGKNHFTYSANADNTVIKVRYEPIEVYQTEGNLQFVKNSKTGVYDMNLDTWRCNEMVQKVKDEFNMQYQLSITNEFNIVNGMATVSTTRDKDQNLIVVARRF